ncbi:MAG: DUF5723 family protein [Bacteroidota bacterium]|nr:DUF5723 family protein [Bacteroidota bacterium]
MKKLSLLILAFLLNGVTIYTYSQNTMYFMDRLPQQLNFNPALFPNVKFFLNLPGIGGNQIDIYNSGFNYNQFKDFTDNLGTENYNPDEFIKSIGDFNQTNLETRTNLFAMGFRLKDKGYFSISASVRSFLELQAPSNFVYLLDDYEKIADRLPLNIEGANIVFNSFSQVAITYSRVFEKKLTIGISPKLIGALGGIRSDKLSLKVSQTGQYDFETEYSGEAQIGLPVPINPQAIDGNGELNPDEDILPENWLDDLGISSLFQNAGFAFDLGVNYELSKRFSVSASLLDIGTSRWSENGYRSSLINETYKIIKNQSVKIKIPSKIYLGINYKLSPKWNTGLLVKNVMYEIDNKASVTLSMNGYMGRKLSTSVSYTNAYSYHNLGLGIRLRILPGSDLFVVTDNLNQLINYEKAQLASLAFGINLAFGIKQKPNVTEDQVQQ